MREALEQAASERRAEAVQAVAHQNADTDQYRRTIFTLRETLESSRQEEEQSIMDAKREAKRQIDHLQSTVRSLQSS